jgi:hypothetical protein
MQAFQSAADELLALEQHLLEPEVRRCREAVAPILADNFSEVRVTPISKE